MTDGMKPVAQARAAATRDKLVAALERLLTQKDFSQISVAEIAAEAGVAVGTVYRRFENKEAFIPQLIERLRIETEAMVDQRFEPGPTMLDTLSRFTLESWRAMQTAVPLYRTIYLHARLRPEMVRDQWQSLEQAALVQVSQLLDHHASEITVPSRALADRIIAYFLGSIFTERALFAHTTAYWIRELDGEELAREAAKMANAYLTAPPVSRVTMSK